VASQHDLSIDSRAQFLGYCARIMRSVIAMPRRHCGPISYRLLSPVDFNYGARSELRRLG
jgi:hypothetical protein